MIEINNECQQNHEEKKVVDERCYCGHLKSEHHSVSQSTSEYLYRHENECKLCLCRQFTWYGWIFEDGSEA